MKLTENFIKDENNNKKYYDWNNNGGVPELKGNYNSVHGEVKVTKWSKEEMDKYLKKFEKRETFKVGVK